MATEIKPIVRPWNSNTHHTNEDLHARYSAQSTGWVNGRGPSFEQVGPMSNIQDRQATSFGQKILAFFKT